MSIRTKYLGLSTDVESHHNNNRQKLCQNLTYRTQFPKIYKYGFFFKGTDQLLP